MKVFLSFFTRGLAIFALLCAGAVDNKAWAKNPLRRIPKGIKQAAQLSTMAQRRMLLSKLNPDLPAVQIELWAQRLKFVSKTPGTPSKAFLDLPPSLRRTILRTLQPTQQEQRHNTLKQWLEIYHANPKELKNGTKLYNAFQSINQKIKKLTEAGRANEISPAEREIVRIYQENKQKAAQKTPEQWLEIYRANPEELTYGTKLYQALNQINHKVKKLKKEGRADEISSAQWEIFRIWQEKSKRIVVVPGF